MFEKDLGILLIDPNGLCDIVTCGMVLWSEEGHSDEQTHD